MPWSARQRHHPLARGGIGKTHRIALYDDHMGMVQQGVDESRCDGLVHELVEANCCSLSFASGISPAQGTTPPRGHTRLRWPAVVLQGLSRPVMSENSIGDIQAACSYSCISPPRRSLRRTCCDHGLLRSPSDHPRIPRSAISLARRGISEWQLDLNPPSRGSLFAGIPRRVIVGLRHKQVIQAPGTIPRSAPVSTVRNHRRRSRHLHGSLKSMGSPNHRNSKTQPRLPNPRAPMYVLT